MAQENQQITVGDLRKLLEDYGDSVPVQTEGCDCDGEAIGVRLMPDGQLLIRRGH